MNDYQQDYADDSDVTTATCIANDEPDLMSDLQDDELEDLQQEFSHEPTDEMNEGDDEDTEDEFLGNDEAMD